MKKAAVRSSASGASSSSTLRSESRRRSCQRQDACEFLPAALTDALRSTVHDSENRTCRLLFKLAVELDMVMNVLAAGMEIPQEDLDRLRGRCVREVKSTNGSVTLKDAVDYQRGGV